MASSCKDHAASTSIDPGCRQCDKHPGAGDVLDEEAVQLTEHVEERHATAQVRSRLGVDSVRHQRGTNAVTGNITDEQAEMVLVQRIYEGEVAADGVHGMIESINAHAVPGQGLRRQAALHPCGKPQVFLDLHLAILELHVGGAEFFFGAYLLRDVRKGRNPKLGTGVLNRPGTDNDGQPAPALARENKVISVAPDTECGIRLPAQKIPFLRGVELRRVKIDQFFPGNTGHFQKTRVRKKYLQALVGYDDAFVEHLQNSLHLG